MPALIDHFQLAAFLIFLLHLISTTCVLKYVERVRTDYIVYQYVISNFLLQVLAFVLN